jgi:hypothetical protein
MITTHSIVTVNSVPFIIENEDGLLYGYAIDFANKAWYIQIPRGYTSDDDISGYIERYQESGLPRIFGKLTLKF